MEDDGPLCGEFMGVEGFFCRRTKPCPLHPPPSDPWEGTSVGACSTVRSGP